MSPRNGNVGSWVLPLKHKLYIEKPIVFHVGGIALDKGCRRADCIGGIAFLEASFLNATASLWKRK